MIHKENSEKNVQPYSLQFNTDLFIIYLVYATARFPGQQ